MRNIFAQVIFSLKKLNLNYRLLFFVVRKTNEVEMTSKSKKLHSNEKTIIKRSSYSLLVYA
jgi:hypothetical protein